MSIKENVKRAKTDYDEVYEAGKQAEWNEFWDNFQNYGNRADYAYGFVGWGFNFGNFYPKYDIKPVRDARRLFYAWENPSSQNGSLKQRLEECGVVLDTSQTTYFEEMFAWGKWTELPTVDMSNNTAGASSAFAYCSSLHTIEKIIVSENSILANNMFTNARALENVAFEGVINGNISFSQSSILSKASIESVISHLSDTASGKTATFSQTAVNTAFTTDEWNALIATKSNWTISLV